MIRRNDSSLDLAYTVFLCEAVYGDRESISSYVTRCDSHTIGEEPLCKVKRLINSNSHYSSSCAHLPTPDTTEVSSVSSCCSNGGSRGHGTISRPTCMYFCTCTVYRCTLSALVSGCVQQMRRTAASPEAGHRRSVTCPGTA